MKREDLIAMGISEENADKIMSDYGSGIQKANAKADQYKADADKAAELQAELDRINAEKMTDAEKQAADLKRANDRIAELEKAQSLSAQRNSVVEKFKVTSEQAKQIVKDDGSFDYDVLGQIISDKEAAAAQAKEQEIAGKAGNPNGAAGTTNPNEKTDDVKNAESITFGTVAVEQSAKDYYKLN